MALMKFDRRKRRVEVDPKTLLLAPLNDIWNLDSSDYKDNANKMLAYVHLICRLDPEAPFYNSDPGEITFLAKKEIYGNFEYEFNVEAELLITEACLAYTKANEIIEERVYHDLCDKIDEIRKKIAITKVEIIRNENPGTGAVTFTSNGAIVTKLISELDAMIEIKDSMWNKLRNARVNEQKVKGQREPSFLEKRQMEGRYGKQKYTEDGDSEGAQGESTSERNSQSRESGISDTRFEPVESKEGVEDIKSKDKSANIGKPKTKRLPAHKDEGFWPGRA